MTIVLNVFNIYKQPIDPSDEHIKVNMIQEFFEECLIDESSEFHPGYFDQYFEDIFGEKLCT